MEFRTPSSPHLPVTDSVPVLMRRVLYALVPGIICATWLLGWGVLINIAIAGATAVAAEAAMLLMRRRPVATTLLDYSALLTGVLLAIALPPLTPWWVAVTGTVFAIVIAKQLYGGLGYNPFNPAMAGYVMVLVSFPLELTLWPAAGDAPDLATTLQFMFGDAAQDPVALDALTAATPMDSVRDQVGRDIPLPDISPEYTGLLGGRGWEWINMAFLAGGLWLLYLRVIQWQIPVAMLGGLALPAALFHLYDPAVYSSPQFHLFSGAAMVGAFFIATDPVSASTTPRGRICFGLGIGILVWIIRTWGGYPEGVAFAVLLMNLAAPTIDFYTRPRVFGQGRGNSP